MPALLWQGCATESGRIRVFRSDHDPVFGQGRIKKIESGSSLDIKITLKSRFIIQNKYIDIIDFHKDKSSGGF